MKKELRANVGICQESQNQFRKIEFWLIAPKQPFDKTISRNDIKKSPSAL